MKISNKNPFSELHTSSYNVFKRFLKNKNKAPDTIWLSIEQILLAGCKHFATYRNMLEGTLNSFVTEAVII